jgi:hypothetical protein
MKHETPRAFAHRADGAVFPPDDYPGRYGLGANNALLVSDMVIPRRRDKRCGLIPRYSRPRNMQKSGRATMDARHW